MSDLFGINVSSSGAKVLFAFKILYVHFREYKILFTLLARIFILP